MNSFVCLWATYARAHIVRCTTLHHRLKWPVSWAILYLFTSFSLSPFSSCPNNHRNLECSCKFVYITTYHTEQKTYYTPSINRGHALVQFFCSLWPSNIYKGLIWNVFYLRILQTDLSWPKKWQFSPIS